MIEYGENIGDIWELVYYNIVKTDYSLDQHMLDRQTRELEKNFNPPLGLSPAEYSVLFMNNFLENRNKARELLSNESKIRCKEMFQLGNEECMKEIYKIESSNDFHSWENPHLVQHFKYLSK